MAKTEWHEGDPVSLDQRRSERDIEREPLDAICTIEWRGSGYKLEFTDYRSGGGVDVAWLKRELVRIAPLIEET